MMPLAPFWLCLCLGLCLCAVAQRAPESNQLQDAHKNNTKIHSSGKTTTASSVNGDSVCVCGIYTQLYIYRQIYVYMYIYTYIYLRIFQAKFLTDFPAQTSWTSALVSCASAFRFVAVFPAVAHSAPFPSPLSPLPWHIKIQSLCYEDK